jgi:hypothetical protein
MIATFKSNIPGLANFEWENEVRPKAFLALSLSLSLSLSHTHTHTHTHILSFLSQVNNAEIFKAKSKVGYTIHEYYAFAFAVLPRCL